MEREPTARELSGDAADLRPQLTLMFPGLAGASLRECDQVAAVALTFLGRSYRITRELDATTIDCSTLVSQAHWLGAAVQTPFIAETQRTASNGADVQLDDLLPGDAIFAYDSPSKFPDGVHNHVALYLGKAADGEPWVIESVGGKGVVLTRLPQARTGGGIRRFCPNPLGTFAPGPWNDLVAKVPKLGRLGARLTSGYGNSDRHRGTDVYVADDAALFAPHDGLIVETERIGGSGVLLYLWAPGSQYLSVLGPLPLRALSLQGTAVRRGDALGGLAAGASRTRCNVIPRRPGGQLVHWELWASGEIACNTPAPGLDPPRITRRLAPGVRLTAVSPLYATKVGALGSCIDRG